MNTNTFKQIQNAEIEVQPYEPNSRALPTVEDVTQRRESLLKSGLINPIIITEDEKNVPFIVDGNLRYNLIRELKAKKKWNSSVYVLQIPFDEAKSHRDIQTNHKNYTKLQLAIFGAYNYWDEVEKRSQQRQNQGKKATGKKGKTAEIVGDMSGVNEKYAQYAHELLEIDAEFFYNTFFIKRYSLKKAEIKGLIAINKNFPEHVKEIIAEMKKIIVNESDFASSNANKTIYERAKKVWENNKNVCDERLIRKLTASDTETEDIKNTFLARINENNNSIPSSDSNTISSTCEEITEENLDCNITDNCASNVIDFNDVTKKLNAANCTAESVETKIFSPNKTLCIITISQPLPEFISSHLKQYIETNSNYTVEIQQKNNMEII